MLTAYHFRGKTNYCDSAIALQSQAATLNLVKTLSCGTYEQHQDRHRYSFRPRKCRYLRRHFRADNNEYLASLPVLQF